MGVVVLTLNPSTWEAKATGSLNTRMWKELPSSWNGRINVVKMAVHQKAFYVVNVFALKIPTRFFTEIRNHF